MQVIAILSGAKPEPSTRKHLLNEHGFQNLSVRQCGEDGFGSANETEEPVEGKSREELDEYQFLLVFKFIPSRTILSLQTSTGVEFIYKGKIKVN